MKRATPGSPGSTFVNEATARTVAATRTGSSQLGREDDFGTGGVYWTLEAGSGEREAGERGSVKRETGNVDAAHAGDAETPARGNGPYT